ncbi:malate synthase A [Streptomyces sp. NPDC059740]|uniref:malate synthase n=1 Tax=Streptomyces sp. NPDC059740 TaxID=3346926 RepID=UPI00364C7FAF
MSVTSPAPRVQVLGPTGDRHDEILTPEALAFVGRLDAAFAGARLALLSERRHRAERLATGGYLDFVPATSQVRADAGWRVPPPPPGLADRRVELCGPPERRAALAAVASGARVWTADFEDATAPTWEAIVEGHLTVLDAVCGHRAAGGRSAAPARSEGEPYRAGQDADHGGRPAVVLRPRGWHRAERHLVVAGRPAPAALVDFGLHAFHCARLGAEGPFLSLPKVENHLEARLWHEVFTLAEDLLGLAPGTIRATVVVETLTAAFEMEEILHELAEHATALQMGRGNYLAGVVRALSHRPDAVLPDMDRVTMTAPFLRAATDLLVRTCHRRGALAVGPRAAEAPGGDLWTDEAVLARVRLEKEREAEEGFDGSVVAHPGLVPVCRAAFDEVLGALPHQVERRRDDVEVRAADLLSLHRTSGPPTPEGLREAVTLSVRYFDAWLRGRGVVEVAGSLVDAGAAEWARTQLWQWVRHGAVQRETVHALLDLACAELARSAPVAPTGQAAHIEQVRELLLRTALSADLPAYFTGDTRARRHLGRTVTARGTRPVTGLAEPASVASAAAASAGPAGSTASVGRAAAAPPVTAAAASVAPAPSVASVA